MEIISIKIMRVFHISGVFWSFRKTFKNWMNYPIRQWVGMYFFAILMCSFGIIMQWGRLRKREKNACSHGLGQMSRFRNPEVDIDDARGSEGLRSVFSGWCSPSTLRGSVASSEDTRNISCDHMAGGKPAQDALQAHKRGKYSLTSLQRGPMH